MRRMPGITGTWTTNGILTERTRGVHPILHQAGWANRMQDHSMGFDWPSPQPGCFLLSDLEIALPSNSSHRPSERGTTA